MEDKKPKIRFKGFDEDWEEDKLDSLFSFDVPHNSLSRDKLNDESGEVQNIHYGDVLIKYGAVVDSHKDEIPYITESKASDFSQVGLKDGDIIFADTAEDTTTGKAIEIQNVRNKCIVAGLHTIVARPMMQFAPSFMGYHFNSDSYHSQLVPLMQGTKVLSINKPALQNTQIDYPKEIVEQQKIGDFFKELDELICSKEQEVEKLKQIKAALLDNMFPNGESDKPNRGGYNDMIISILQNNRDFIYHKGTHDTPCIRFRGFTEPWEKKCISSYVTFSKGRGYSKSDIAQEGTPLLLYGSMYTNYQTNIISSNTFAKEKDYTVKSEGREVVVPASGETVEDIARASAIKTKGIILGGDLNIITPNENIDTSFLALEITYGNSHRQLVKKAQGVSVVHLHNSDIKDIYLCLPELEEQRMIGEFFREHDTTIMNAQNQISKLRNIKQACLQKMFA